MRNEKEEKKENDKEKQAHSVCFILKTLSK